MIDKLVGWFETRRAVSQLKKAGIVSPDLKVSRGVLVEVEPGAKVKIANRVSIGPYSIIRVRNGATLEIQDGCQVGARVSIYASVSVKICSKAILGDGVVVTDSDPVIRQGNKLSPTAVSGSALVVPEQALVPPNTLINPRSRAVNQQQGGSRDHHRGERTGGGDRPRNERNDRNRDNGGRDNNRRDFRERNQNAGNANANGSGGITPVASIAPVSGGETAEGVRPERTERPERNDRGDRGGRNDRGGRGRDRFGGGDRPRGGGEGGSNGPVKRGRIEGAPDPGIGKISFETITEETFGSNGDVSTEADTSVASTATHDSSETTKIS